MHDSKTLVKDEKEEVPGIKSLVKVFMHSIQVKINVYKFCYV